MLVEDWYEQRGLVVKILNTMQWKFKHDLQKMARNLDDKHKEIQLIKHELRLRPTISLNEQVQDARKNFISMLESFNQQMLIARLTSMGNS